MLRFDSLKAAPYKWATGFIYKGLRQSQANFLTVSRAGTKSMELAIRRCMS